MIYRTHAMMDKSGEALWVISTNDLKDVEANRNANHLKEVDGWKKNAVNAGEICKLSCIM